MRYGRFILSLLAALVAVSAHCASQVELIETEMTLKHNGDADVMTRVWMQTPASIPFSIEMGLWDGTTIDDLTMTNENDSAFADVTSLGGKPGVGQFCLKQTGSAARISWTTIAGPKHVYVLRYTLRSLVKKGFLCNNMLLTVVRPTEPKANRINLIIKREKGIFVDDIVDVRTVGVKGRALIEQGKILASSHEIVNDMVPMTNDDSLMVIAKFTPPLFSPEKEAGMGYYESLWASGYRDYKIRDWYDSLEKLLAWGTLFGFVAAVVILLYGGKKLWSRIRYVFTLYPLRKWLQRRSLHSKSQWYRDLPLGGSLALANMALVRTTSHLNPPQDGILGALILRLINRGAASSEMVEPVYGAEPQQVLRLLEWKSLPQPSPDERLERSLYNTLVAAAGPDKILQTRELELYMRDKDSPHSEVMHDIEMAGMQQKITDKDLEQLYGLRKFLLEFTLIGSRETRELSLWREYMVYAQLFGIADKVSQNFREAYPDFLQFNDLAWRIARVPDVFSYGK